MEGETETLELSLPSFWAKTGREGLINLLGIYCSSLLPEGGELDFRRLVIVVFAVIRQLRREIGAQEPLMLVQDKEERKRLEEEAAVKRRMIEEAQELITAYLKEELEPGSQEFKLVPVSVPSLAAEEGGSDPDSEPDSSSPYRGGNLLDFQILSQKIKDRGGPIRKIKRIKD